jgi:DNA-binding transcriptional regulator GbsR (MarR family)
MGQLTPVQEDFILHWGEMGSTWGINRAVAQIYALLYLSPQPLTADEIGETLGIARSTVSTGLRDLQNWGLIKVVHALGDRRDHFQALEDVWEMFRVILRERKRREFDPTLALLRQSAAELQADTAGDAYVRERLQEMLDFFEAAAAIYDQVAQLPTDALAKVARLGDRFSKIIRLVLKG